jgi:NADP-dependent 3-hydroxy acid dehydrogenase YdfG
MDKVVVVTGASAGIGAELAKQLAAKGAKVVLAARRKEELDAVAKGDRRARARGRHGRHEAERRRAPRQGGDRALRRIDVWVNNAGRGISRSVAELTDEDLDAMWTVNMKSVVYGIQAVLPHFKSKNAGQIINISSGLSRAPLAPVRAAYGAVKAQ